MSLLEVRSLRKQFGGLSALSDLSFEVEEGEIVSIIGPNGAGKSTLFNVITALYEPEGGEVAFDGDSLVGLKPNQITRLGVARTFQTVHLFPSMTILENAMVGQHCRTKDPAWSGRSPSPGMARGTAGSGSGAGALVVLWYAPERYRQEHRRWRSYANRRRFEIARALATEPRLLLLDEPTAGMNPRETAELTDQITRLRKERGLTIVVIEHDMRVVKGVWTA